MDVEFKFKLDENQAFWFKTIIREDLDTLLPSQKSLKEEKFECVKKILLAYYGKKWHTLRGWYSTSSYCDSQEIQKVISTAKIIDNGISIHAIKISSLFETYQQIEPKDSQLVFQKLKSYEINEDEKWAVLLDILNGLGVNCSLNKAKELSHQLIYHYRY